MAGNSVEDRTENMETTQSPTPNSTSHPAVEDDEIKSKKPGDTAFKQQRLPAWQPILTAGTVLPAFFIVGIVFIPLGVGFLVTSNNVKETILDYTSCTQDNDVSCINYFKNATGTCICKIPFNLTEDYEKQVYIYYRLENYYQNHRRYVNSRDDLQLLGQSVNEPSKECAPYQYDDVDNVSMAILPCGAIANSLFNDTFELTFHNQDGQSNTSVAINKNGLAWPSDVETKFNNPESFEDTVQPPNWSTNISDIPNQLQNEDFIVWMRTAALPTFRKLNGRVRHVSETVFDKQLPKGMYTLTVNYRYLVNAFEGKKSFVLTTTSWLGGKNSFLGIAYIVTGSLCVAFGALFLLIHIKHGKRYDFHQPIET
ncbi:cell cycle control protein 50A-like isoform X2 [Antedon mediterranea]|uniref:cell cycle control protein 50A-like isoform X2 n=1 Tax=Antedon mediterranea TaxID=105859 RepID=UPI003AF71D10